MTVAETLALRPYQEEALGRMAEAEARGSRRQMLVAATGLGKTVIFVAKAQRTEGRTLILAHRDELIGQAAAKVREWWPDADVGIVKAGADTVGARVVVASVQTLARARRRARLVEWAQGDPFGLVVVDEAHHAAAATYREILGELRAGEPGGPLLLGVTATPDRGDGKGLDDLFDEIVAVYDLLWGVRSGYLSDLRGLRVRLDLDLADVKVRRGDYAEGALGAEMEQAGGPDVVARAVAEHAADRRTIVFTPTVEMAQHTAERLRDRGVPAAAVWGAMPLEDRRATLDRFSAGEIRAVVNCQVLTEGFDEPRADCIVVARPTKSRALYVQMVGRGTRRHVEKADCLVIDVVGATEVHDLCTIPSLFGVDPRVLEEREGETVVAAMDRHEAEEVRAGRLAAEEVMLFAALRRANFAWVKVTAGRFALNIGLHNGQDRTVVIKRSKDDETLWSAGILGRDPDGREWAKALIRNVSQEHAMGAGEDFARKFGRSHLIRADSEWRRRKPTARQLETADRWGVTVPAAANAGEVSDLIEAQIQRARARRMAKRAATATA